MDLPGRRRVLHLPLLLRNSPCLSFPPLPHCCTAGGVAGRVCTAYPACGPEVVAAGGLHRDVDASEVVVDGNLVSWWPSRS